MRRPSLRSRLATARFAEPSTAADLLESVSSETAAVILDRLDSFEGAADPDVALREVISIIESGAPGSVLADRDRFASLIRLLGASEGLAAAIPRIDGAVAAAAGPWRIRSQEEYRDSMLAAVEGLEHDDAVVRMRQAYRLHLIEIAGYDLSQPEPTVVMQDVTRALSDIAAGALEAALAISRQSAAEKHGSEQTAQVRLSIIAMGKLGARELNYLSDVDVIWVHDGGDLDGHTASRIARDLARDTIAACSALAREAALWEVDSNLRPEGKDGALTRTLSSHVAYYERWAKDWEFQALLKARHVAGDAELGAEYEAAIAPFVWNSSARDGFVESVHRMRERVTEHIASDEAARQLKLGPGGLRDIEFTVQLLQLVHGATDDGIRHRGTLPALSALSEGGYIGRSDATEFAEHYRFLRLLEHRLQLWRMSRTHLMPEEQEDLRRLARAAGASSADRLMERWQTVKRDVRELHQRIFYRPLLSAVAALPDDQIRLTSDQAVSRLGAIGFADAKTALQHIAALTSGVSRRSQIQKVLLPVLLQWFGEGPDPDSGLVAFRRLSESLGDSPWFLGMLRDSKVAAERLTFLLSTSKLIAGLMERMPESASWIGTDQRLAPRTEAALREEALAIVKRHKDDAAAAADGLRHIRRRELLRAAMASAVGIADPIETAETLVSIARAVIDAGIRLHEPDRDYEFAVLSMGRTGGSEIGFGSDIDVLYVVRGPEGSVERATALVRKLAETVRDRQIKFELDPGLRPEGRKGPLVRSLKSYASYYERWSEVWEAQALLRAAPLAGDASLSDDFIGLIDPIRYSGRFTARDAREIRRIKARVESERLPQNAERARHLKLGSGSLSDVEWLVQLLQLQHVGEHPELQTPSTLDALDALVEHEVIARMQADTLREAWMLSSRLRNALSLAQARTIDVLPHNRAQLESVARILGYPAGGAAALEEDYLHATRRSRRIFEQLFFEE
ncbi:bifunctional [glutamine synthetase] adenylyltransferase/[glutamine synthetase]-adenylyl-L-tyrosine phosphorylase [Agrococcus casei]|uniref:bifunctional [glutamine synthetase] adenylyltransferase/[glutamine synthetase]-adenylyl-L-tyrosine phosphorylase n=1 Tax=Agrococcus casei TaxID=343512 RepID=UPI003F927ABC